MKKSQRKVRARAVTERELAASSLLPAVTWPGGRTEKTTARCARSLTTR